MPIRAHHRPGPPPRIAGGILLAALTLLPIANIARIIATTGANVPSSDDAIFMTQFLAPALDGTFAPRDFFRATFYNTHAMYLPNLLYLANARLTAFNLYALLYLGLALAAVRIPLLWFALTRRADPPLPRALLWPILAALTCSEAQISIFEHGLTTLGQNLTTTLLVVGAWCLARWPGHPRALWPTIGAGIAASFTFGSGLALWPAFLLGMWLVGFRKVGHYLAWAAGAAIAALPYLYFLVLHHAPGSANAAAKGPLRVLLTPPTILGLPLSLGYSRPLAGLIGLGSATLATLGLALLWRVRHGEAPRRAAPALMLLTYGGVVALQIGLFRGATAAWYTYVGMAFWVGLIGLAYILRAARVATASPILRLGGRAVSATAAWCGATLATLLVLYPTANLSYRDKSIFLQTRGPASASCVRNYRVAPTYCENTLVTWPPGNPAYLPDLAAPLARHRLAVFAPRQEWALQGDTLLDAPFVGTTGGQDAALWSADRTARPTPPTDYRHLNLLLRAPAALTWTVALPPTLRAATLRTAFARGAVPGLPTGGAAQLTVGIVGADGTAHPLVTGTVAPGEGWREVGAALTPFAGQTIALRFAVQGPDAATWGAFRYPLLDLDLGDGPDAGVALPLVAPARTESDLRFPIDDASRWRAGGLLSARGGPPGRWIVDGEPALIALGPLAVCLTDYAYFSVQLAAAREFFPRALQIRYRLAGQADFPEGQAITIPLLADDAPHIYTYPLRLLGLPAGARLTGLGLDPVYGAASGGTNIVQIDDFRLIRAPDARDCAP
jgi:hypothetical protein